MQTERRGPPRPTPPPAPWLPFADELLAAAEPHDEPMPRPPPAPSAAAASSAPRTTFASLPAEIRSAIWRATLPPRVVGILPHDRDAAEPAFRPLVDVPRGAGAGRCIPQPAASTCYESRAVVLGSGRWTRAAERRPVWLDPRRDVLLLNSSETDDYYAPDDTAHPADRPGEDSDSSRATPNSNPGRTDGVPPGAAAPGDPLAHLAQLRLVACLEAAVRAGGRIAVPHELLLPWTGRALFPLLRVCAAAAAVTGAELLVYFDEVVVTGTRAQAAASGLFGGGTAPEEQMALVPLRDRATLRRLLAGGPVRPRWPGDERRRGCGLGGLRMGETGFLRDLLRREAHVQHGQSLLATWYLCVVAGQVRGIDGPPELVVEQAIQRGMPLLEPAILLRFHEVGAAGAAGAVGDQQT